MIELDLKTNNKSEELIKQYLQKNVSQSLADKINNGVKIQKDNKTLISKKELSGFMKYANNEARKLAQKGASCACIEDKTVYAWAIHYFEEDTIEGNLFNEDGSEYKPIVKTNKTTSSTKVEPKKEENKQETLFDIFDFNNTKEAEIKEPSKEIEIEKQEKTMTPILETIINYIPAPNVDIDGGFQFQPALLDYNDFVGRIGIGRVKRGSAKVGEIVSCVRRNGSFKQFRIQKMYGFLGLKRIEVNEAKAGEIVAIAGLPDIEVGETVCTIGKEEALPLLNIDEPTLQMTFGVNTSPFCGKEGKILTARKIEERLYKETERDVSLKVEPNDNESFIVSGRGELHLSILIENMRREGFELQVSKPQVITKEIDGVMCEPFEDVLIEVPEDYVGTVIEAIGNREGEMVSMSNHDNQVRLNYIVPSRGLIGFMTEFMTMTKGYGIINHTFKEYRQLAGFKVGQRKQGVLVSMENGKATAYALGQLEDRGVMFIEPGAEVYEGMIVGENNHENDLAVNVVKGKKLTNTRASGSDHTVVLKRPRILSLEGCLDYINNDELVEITPLSYRLRKKILNTELRKKADSKK